MLRNLMIILLLLLNSLLICCAQAPGQNGYDEIKKIPLSEGNERLNRFSAYPVDEQIDIYLYSQYNVEGGSDEFFRFMASDGEKKIPTILRRIDTDSSPDPRTKVGLIRVLDFIDLNCKCLA